MSVFQGDTFQSGFSMNVEPSAVAFADGSIYCFGQVTATMVKIDASNEKFTEQGRFKLPEASEHHEPDGMYWTHPVVAAGKLFLRDQDLLFCYDLK